MPWLATLACALGVVSANAEPRFSHLWAATTGNGTPGRSDITAAPGDEVWLEVVLETGNEGFQSAHWDMVGTPGLLSASSDMPMGQAECPFFFSPFPVPPGVIAPCFSLTHGAFRSPDPGVVDSGSVTSGYDADSGPDNPLVPSIAVIGLARFVVQADGGHCVHAEFPPPLGGIFDAAGSRAIPPPAFASINGGCPGLPALRAEQRDDLEIDSGGDGVTDPGDGLRYTITIANRGDSQATAVTYRVTPDPNTTLINGSVVTSQGVVVTGNAGGDAEALVDLGTLAAGDDTTVALDVRVSESRDLVFGSVRSQGLVTSAELDDVPTDDPDTPLPLDPTVTPVRTLLDRCEQGLGMCEETVDLCEADLEACRLDPPFPDADGDGEHDWTDACPGTPRGQPVDTAGCSRAQFCARIDAAGPSRAAACNRADWRNDEPLGNAADCQLRRGACTTR